MVDTFFACELAQVLLVVVATPVVDPLPPHGRECHREAQQPIALRPTLCRAAKSQGTESQGPFKTDTGTRPR